MNIWLKTLVMYRIIEFTVNISARSVAIPDKFSSTIYSVTNEDSSSKMKQACLTFNYNIATKNYPYHQRFGR